MKQILVTGGAGFIGSHLCARLLEEGNYVICLDNYFTGSVNNILHLEKNPYFELVRHDITSPYSAEIDEIYNLACPASPVYYQVDPIQTVKTSVMGAINMLGLAKRKKAKILHSTRDDSTFAGSVFFLVCTFRHVGLHNTRRGLKIFRYN